MGSTSTPFCPSNCTGNPCVGGYCVCAYPSNEVDCAIDWADVARVRLLVFLVAFSLLFAVLLLASLLQLIRWLYLTGLRPNVPKYVPAQSTLLFLLCGSLLFDPSPQGGTSSLYIFSQRASFFSSSQLLHCVIFLQAMLRLGWLLSAGVEVLGHHALRTLVEGMIDGLGIAALIVCYLLCILLWLQVLNQITPSGEKRSTCVRFRTPIISVLIALYLVVELAVRATWNISDNPTTIFVSIAVYHCIVLLATLFCSLAFVVISVQLYRLLRDSAARNPAALERMVTMMRFTLFTLVISVLTLLSSMVFFGIEFFHFKWENWDSWLIEQAFMRALEAAYSVGTLWFLRKVPAHELRPERRALLSPTPVNNYGSQSRSRSERSEGFEHDAGIEEEAKIRRKLSLEPSFENNVSDL